MLAATIIIPTFDHGPTLLRSVATALQQTVPDVEVFIIGDGVPAGTREVVAGLRADPRVRFFDHPKGPRHGEVYRHAALQDARGEIVCYLSDDDLWLPDHVATMRALLAEADFAHALPVSAAPDGSLSGWTVDLALTADRDLLLAGHNRVPLSCGAHTLDLYRRLPHGWRTTPKGTHTDLYMWQQILAVPGCRAVSGTRPTVLTFPSPPRPNETVEERCAELDRWLPRLGQPALIDAIYDMVVRDRARQVAELRVRVDELAAWGTRSMGEVEQRNGLIRELQREFADRTAWAERAAAEAEQHAETVRALQREIRERTTWAHSLGEEVERRNEIIQDVQHQLAERTAWAQDLAATVAERDATIRGLQEELADRTAWSQRLNDDLAEAAQAIQRVQQELEERTAWAQRASAEAGHLGEVVRATQRELEERTAWALDLDKQAADYARRIEQLQRALEERTALALRSVYDAESRDALIRQLLPEGPAGLT